MELYRAKYGGNGKYNDVTSTVKKYLDRKTLILCVENKIFGDPLPMVKKELIMTMKNKSQKKFPEHTMIFLKSLTMIHKIIIVSNKYVQTLTNDLRNLLEKMGFIISVQHDIDVDDQTLHLIIGPRRFSKMPPNYIIYQLEQYDRPGWITPTVVSFIKNSVMTFEYNQSNYDKFDTKVQKRIVYQPIPIANHLTLIKDYKYDILFYGGPSVRRQKILDYLKRKYNMMICNDLFGSEIIDIISKSKIILNLHICDKSLLETVRLHEVLPYNNLIISELPDDKSDQPYHKVINFVEVIKNDLSNIGQLEQKIGYCLCYYDQLILDQLSDREKTINTLFTQSKNLLMNNLFH